MFAQAASFMPCGVGVESQLARGASAVERGMLGKAKATQNGDWMTVTYVMLTVVYLTLMGPLRISQSLSRERSIHLTMQLTTSVVSAYNYRFGVFGRCCILFDFFICILFISAKRSTELSGQFGAKETEGPPRGISRMERDVD